MSVLDSTRKDFEALLSNQEFSSQSASPEKERSRSSKKNKKKVLKKQRRKEEDAQPLELVQIKSSKKSKHALSTSSSEDGEAYVNQLFWYEEEKSTPARDKVDKQCGDDRNGALSKASVYSEVKSGSNVVRSASSKGKDSATTSFSSSEKSSTDSPVSKVSTAKSKKSSRSLKSVLRSSSKETDDNPKSTPSKRQVRTSAGLLRITVHRTDQLIFDHPNMKPMVVVHVVNRENGHYITHNETPVPPQFSSSWTSKENASPSAPVWNQELQFPVDSSNPIESLLVFFDVVSEPSNDQKSQLAWGFLRPVSRLGVKHLDRKIQIQLYRVPLRQLLHQAKATITDLFSWYQSPQKDKYPSTLHVTVHFESDGDKENEEAVSKSTNPLISLGSPLRRGRLNGQPFRLPTRRRFTFSNTSGSLVSSYSPDGKYLAFALTCGEINIHGNNETPLTLKGHLGNVYDLDWKCGEEDEPQLLSCGADCTARVWKKSICIILPHPTYVYAARFGADERIATGCYDQLVRLWEFDLRDASVRLISSYANHTSAVNALCWNADGRLFSADASGSICVWGNEHSGLQFERSLSSSKEHIPINSLFLHPNGNRILVHYRGDDIALLDARSGLKLVNYTGVYNHRLKLTSSITPCGNYVVSGSEDGSIYWFDLERGDLVAIMSFQNAGSHPVPSVAFHPHEHVMAISSLCSDLSVVLAEFNSNDTQVLGFSVVTFPRTVQSAAQSIVSFTQGRGKLKAAASNTTPTLDKLERIFRKLDLVMAWSRSEEKP